MIHTVTRRRLSHRLPVLSSDEKMATGPVNVTEFRELARRALPKMIFDFVDGGAEDEVTLRENVEAFKRITYLFWSSIFPLSIFSQ